MSAERFPKRGEQIENGAILINFSEVRRGEGLLPHRVALCWWGDKWVVWNQVYHPDLNKCSTSTGDYFKEEAFDKAVECFKERAAKYETKAHS